MDQKERDAQRALGTMEKFRVSATIPIKVNVRVMQNVEAVSEEDAIEKLKMLHDIITDNELLHNALSNVRVSNAEFDTSVKRKYIAKQINSMPLSSGDSCDSGGK